MAKRIVWTIQAKNDRREILNYWFKRNGNKSYSQKLAFQFRETVKHIAKYNYLGRATDLKNVRVSVCGDYLVSVHNINSNLWNNGMMEYWKRQGKQIGNCPLPTATAN